ncbi:MAG: 4Fe-4S binding protein [Deinococcaceae bacterium]
MFNILEAFLKTTDLRPRFTPARCLVVRYSVDGCTACQDACPHEAVQIEPDQGEVRLDPQLCTGCGLCVLACPSGALEYDTEACMVALKQQENRAKLCCSQVQTGSPAVRCLARLTPGILAVSQAWEKTLVLQHGDCSSCAVGSGSVPASLDGLIEQTQRHRNGFQWFDISIEEHDTAPRQVSRRGALGELFSSARRMVAHLIPERPLPFVDWNEIENRTPSDWQWRLKSIRLPSSASTPVFWPTPKVDDSCILCPVCTNVCPTEAIGREILPDGSFELRLNPAACTGCRACDVSCPPQAISMQDTLPFCDIAQTHVLQKGSGSH